MFVKVLNSKINFVAAFLTQTVCLDETTVKFEIWDTAGQERYHSLAPMYYRGAQAAIVVYDITNQVSHDKLHKTKDNGTFLDTYDTNIQCKCDLV